MLQTISGLAELIGPMEPSAKEKTSRSVPARQKPCVQKKAIEP